MPKRFWTQYRHLLLFVGIAFAAGLAVSAIGYMPVQHERDALLADQQRLQQQYQDALHKLAACEVDTNVLRNSKTALRRSLDEQQQQLAEQDKALGFYRQLMVADTPKEGLDLNAFSLIPLAVANQYLYRFTFVQYARNHALLNLALSIDVRGTQNGEERSYPLSQLLVAGTELPERLRFKYFQVVEGTLTLPVDFQPGTIILRAVSSAKNAAPWEREVNWQLQEP